MKFEVLDSNGATVDTVELSDAVFGITPNEKAMHAAVVNFLANQRHCLLYTSDTAWMWYRYKI